MDRKYYCFTLIISETQKELAEIMNNSEGMKDGEVAYTRVMGVLRAKVKYMIYAVGPYYIKY